MVRSLVPPSRARLLLIASVCAAIVAGAVLWSAIRHEAGAEVVDESPQPGWRTIKFEDVRVTIPAAWERSDMDDCEFQFEHWGPPGSARCGVATGVAFYRSATFDPAHGPGVERTEAPGDSAWGGYTYAGDFAVYVAADDRGIVQRALKSAH